LGRKKKEKMATPEQMKHIEQLLGEPLEDFIQTFTNEHKRKIFTDSLAKKLKQSEWLTKSASANGMYQPIYSEQLLQQININPHAASSQQIEQWLLSPQYFDQNLRHLSQYLSYAVGQYSRTVSYMNTIKSFNYVLLPSDSDVEGNVDTKEYLHAYDICLRTLQKMNIKYQIPKVDLQTMEDGVAFYWISETSDTISLLQLPTDYCYITAPWTYGFMFAIDLTFFDQFISVPCQIPELYEAYIKFTTMRKELLEGEALAPYQYYQVPVEKGWVFTFNPSKNDKLPPLVYSMSAALDTLSYKDLLKNKMALDLFKVIAMKIPLDKDNKQMAVPYKLAEEITQVIQSTLPSNMRAYSSPFESELFNVDQSNRFDEIVNISNDTFYASSGFSKSMFGSSEIKQGTAMKFSSLIDFAYVSTHMYSQYANFVNWILMQKTKKYRFQVRFFGNKLNEKEEIEMYANLVRTTNSHLLEFFAATGKEPFQVKSSLILEDKLGLRNLMIPLNSMFNSKQDGRPTQTSVSDGGEVSRDMESNENRDDD
jgi:hypothetical protein